MCRSSKSSSSDDDSDSSPLEGSASPSERSLLVRETFGERVRAGVRVGGAVWCRLGVVPLTESVDFEPWTGEGRGRGGIGGTWGVLDMGAADATPLAFRAPDCLRALPLGSRLELVAERTDLASPSLTTPTSSCDWAF